MIAITDVSTLTDLDTEAAVANVDLTSDEVGQLINNGAIINAAITQAVKSLLNSILTNTGNLNISGARSIIAGYAGFKTVNGVTTFNAANVSIDKLTFYIIFRLPFANNNLKYENPIPESATVPATGATSWGKFANYIRGLSGSGVLRINSAGEQVNTSNLPVNDSNQVIDGWYNEAAYNLLGEHPFNGTYTIPPGLYTATTEKAMLFGQNTDVPNDTGVQPLDITKIPLYFYLLAKVENPYSSVFWLNPNKDSTSISRVCHWPAKVTLNDLRRHFVKVTSGLNGATISNASYSLQHDSSGTFFLATPPNSQTKLKLYISPLDLDALAFEGISLSTANQVEKTDDGYLAVWNNYKNNPG